MKKATALLFIGLMVSQTVVFASDPDFETNTRTQPGYFQNLAQDWKRGLTNLVSFPLEIPITIKMYHNEGKGAVIVRDAAGFADGIIRSLVRATAGAWDLVTGFVPGDQDGGIVKPATLFEKSAN